MGDDVLLHIIVVGFHHKKGCQVYWDPLFRSYSVSSLFLYHLHILQWKLQVEYAYPPLVEGTDEASGELPEEWKHLPTLALPDGSHNYSKGMFQF